MDEFWRNDRSDDTYPNPALREKGEGEKSQKAGRRRRSFVDIFHV